MTWITTSTVPLLSSAPMDTVSPSEDRLVDLPDESPAASSSMLGPIWIHVSVIGTAQFGDIDAEEKILGIVVRVSIGFANVRNVLGDSDCALDILRSLGDFKTFRPFENFDILGPLVIFPTFGLLMMSELSDDWIVMIMRAKLCSCWQICYDCTFWEFITTIKMINLILD